MIGFNRSEQQGNSMNEQQYGNIELDLIGFAEKYPRLAVFVTLLLLVISNLFSPDKIAAAQDDNLDETTSSQVDSQASLSAYLRGLSVEELGNLVDAIKHSDVRMGDQLVGSAFQSAEDMVVAAIEEEIEARSRGHISFRTEETPSRSMIARQQEDEPIVLPDLDRASVIEHVTATPMAPTRIASNENPQRSEIEQNEVINPALTGYPWIVDGSSADFVRNLINVNGSNLSEQDFVSLFDHIEGEGSGVTQLATINENIKLVVENTPWLNDEDIAAVLEVQEVNGRLFVFLNIRVVNPNGVTDNEGDLVSANSQIILQNNEGNLSSFAMLDRDGSDNNELTLQVPIEYTQANGESLFVSVSVNFTQINGKFYSESFAGMNSDGKLVETSVQMGTINLQGANLNLRSIEDNEIIGLVAGGSKVDVIGLLRETNQFIIRTPDDQLGLVSADYINVVSNFPAVANLVLDVQSELPKQLKIGNNIFASSETDENFGIQLISVDSTNPNAVEILGNTEVFRSLGDTEAFTVLPAGYVELGRDLGDGWFEVLDDQRVVVGIIHESNLVVVPEDAEAATFTKVETQIKRFGEGGLNITHEDAQVIVIDTDTRGTVPENVMFSEEYIFRAKVVVVKKGLEKIGVTATYGEIEADLQSANSQFLEMLDNDERTKIVSLGEATNRLAFSGGTTDFSSIIDQPWNIVRTGESFGNEEKISTHSTVVDNQVYVFTYREGLNDPPNYLETLPSDISTAMYANYRSIMSNTLRDMSLNKLDDADVYYMIFNQK